MDDEDYDDIPERDPEPKPECKHVWKKAALDSSVWCMKCRAYGGEAN